jgi:hypothetical protein
MSVTGNASTMWPRWKGSWSKPSSFQKPQLSSLFSTSFTIHTWPEYGYCALDIFTCGDLIDSDVSLRFLKERFEAKKMSIVDIKRGVLDIPSKNLKHKP